MMATHNFDIVKKFKKRVIVMENGKIKKEFEEGTFKNEVD
jgi:ABC-type ATPase involved in cell division